MIRRSQTVMILPTYHHLANSTWSHFNPSCRRYFSSTILSAPLCDLCCSSCLSSTRSNVRAPFTGTTRKMTSLLWLIRTRNAMIFFFLLVCSYTLVENIMSLSSNLSLLLIKIVSINFNNNNENNNEHPDEDRLKWYKLEILDMKYFIYCHTIYMMNQSYPTNSIY